MRSSPNQPIWQSRISPSVRPAPTGDRSVDVAVVGAGIAGLTTALLLAQAGLDVAVFEARTIGAGTTGHTTAKVSALQGVRYQTLARHHGNHVLRSYARAQVAALQSIAATIEDHGIDCHWERRTAYTYAADAGQRRDVETELIACGRAGLEAQLVEDPGLPFENHGAVALHDQAQFDPQLYLEGLAAAIEACPTATIYEHARVTAVDGLRRPSVTTDGGTVHADHVVVCTLLPMVDRGLFFARSEPKMSYTIAADVDGELPDGMYLSAGDPSRSLRTAHHQGREVLVVGGAGHTVGRSTPTHARYEQLEDWTAATFAGARIVGRWCAHDAVPDDQLPWAGPSSPLTPNVLVAGGFAKWGMTNGTAAAHVLADRILGQSDGPSADWRQTFDTARFPPRALSETARINAGVAVNMISGWARPRHDDADRHDGSTRRRALVPTGTSEDQDGVLRERKLVCTHLGGICAWNDAERTWDCPLHGSRFDTDGAVVAAPAVTDLG